MTESMDEVSIDEVTALALALADARDRIAKLEQDVALLHEVCEAQRLRLRHLETRRKTEG